MNVVDNFWHMCQHLTATNRTYTTRSHSNNSILHHEISQQQIEPTPRDLIATIRTYTTRSHSNKSNLHHEISQQQIEPTPRDLTATIRTDTTRVSLLFLHVAFVRWIYLFELDTPNYFMWYRTKGSWILDGFRLQRDLVRHLVMDYTTFTSGCVSCRFIRLTRLHGNRFVKQVAPGRTRTSAFILLLHGVIIIV